MREEWRRDVNDRDRPRSDFDALEAVDDATLNKRDGNSWAMEDSSMKLCRGGGVRSDRGSDKVGQTRGRSKRSDLRLARFRAPSLQY